MFVKSLLKRLLVDVINNYLVPVLVTLNTFCSLIFLAVVLALHRISF